MELKLASPALNEILVNEAVPHNDKNLIEKTIVSLVIDVLLLFCFLEFQQIV